MQLVYPGSYVIFSKADATKCVGADELQLNLFDPTSSRNTWLVNPIGGSYGFYLEHMDSGKCVRFGTTPLTLGDLDPGNDELVIQCDDRGDGWVAINNHDGSRVFDLSDGDTFVGTPIDPYSWNGGDGEIWRMVPTSALGTPPN